MGGLAGREEQGPWISLQVMLKTSSEPPGMVFLYMSMARSSRFLPRKPIQILVPGPCTPG